MEYAMPHFRVDFRDWMKGNNLYDDYPSGGLLASAEGYNPFRYPGLLAANKDYPTSSTTSSLVRTPVLSWTVTSRNDGELVGVGIDADPNTYSAGTFYRINPTTGAMTAFNDGAAPTTTYRLGWTDCETFGTRQYFTSQEDVVQIDALSSGYVIDETWGETNGLGASGLSASYPHPLGRFDSLLYVGDGHRLHEIDHEAGTILEFAFDNLPDEVTTTALVQHRSYLLIAASYFFAQFGSQNAKVGSVIFVWDGYSPTYADTIAMPDTVTAMKQATDGTLFIWTIRQFGYMNGSTFVPLKALNNRVYKSQIFDVPNGIVYADGDELIRYSSAVPNGKKFFTLQATVAHTITSAMLAIEDYPIIITEPGAAGSGKNLLFSNLDTGTSGTKTFQFNQRVTRVTVKVRHVVIETEGLGTGYITVKYYDQNGTLQDCGTFTSADTAMNAKRTWNFDIFSQPGTTVIKPVITISGDAKLKSVEFYYEQVGQVNNP